MAVLVKKIAMLSVMAAISAAFGVVALYFLIDGIESQQQSILGGQPIIVLKTLHGYLPGAIISAAGVFLFALALFAFLYKEALYKKILPYCNWTCAIGIASIVIGGLGINYYWHQSAQEQGYVKCGLTDRVSTAKMHTSYWAKDKKLCGDAKLAKILRHPSQERLKKANDYLMSIQE